MLPVRTGSRLLLVAICCVYAAAQDGSADDQVRRPPNIVQGPAKKYEAYKDDSDLSLTCKTSGVPEPKVKWTKNGRVLNEDEFTRVLADGTLQLRSLTIRQQGYYQCLAENSYGKSMSNTVFLEQTRSSIESNEKSIPYTAKEGEPLEVKCRNAVIVPEDKAEFHWTAAKDRIETGHRIDTNSRISIDNKGNLYFAYTTIEDAKNGFIYKCQVRNAIRDDTLAGSYSIIDIQPNPGAFEFKPIIKFPQGDDVIQIALKGAEKVEMKCIFAGKPEPSIKWEKKGGNLPADRHRYKDLTKQVLIIDRVRLEDEGDYICTGFQGATLGEHQTIKLKVEAVPEFTKPENKPKNANVTAGNDAVFNCKTDAIPKASIQWYKNGDPLSASGNIQISENTLTVRNVQKPEDLMVIQCNASNYHGYQFVDAYLNVLVKTEITLTPTSLDVEANVTEVMFHVEAKTDISTPLYYKWKFGEDDITYEPGVIEMLPNNTLWINFTGMAFPDKGKFIGTYTVEVTNTYSSEKASADLFIQDVPTSAPVIIATADSFDLWWVILLVAILLLLLLLLLCCCMWCQRNRGDSYPVDEKERANGNDPEKELVDDGYKDYVRPEDEPVKGSRASLNSSIKLDSDDEGSLNEYGDIDTGKFNEDGSFIGLYGTDKKKKEGAPPPYKQNDTTV